ncbi:MAG: ABC transporter ATP-binding protein [Bacterioplanes sp.]|nr:ABC transporter ATP-binding protein [Bacterioplanes sp.]
MNLIELQSVNQYYGTLQVLNDITLTIPAGEIIGLFGHNGAGKTTTMKLILGLLSPTEGQVHVFGQSPQSLDVRQQMGYLPENVMFYPQLTGLETLRHFARLKSSPTVQVDTLLEQVGLTHAARRKVKTYSKGMRQRLGLAQALLGTPRLLLLDEPTVGLDPIATQELYDLIGTLRDQGTSIILCSHVLPGVEAFIDRAAILAGGKLQAFGTLAELRRQVALPTTLRIAPLMDTQPLQNKLAALGLTATVVGQHTLSLRVEHHQRLAAIQHLLPELNDLDLDVSPPSLDDLYRHYFAQLTTESH